MRGKEHGYYSNGFSIRITPAHAGKSNSITDIKDLIKDHPRTCGEKFLLLLKRYHFCGSPPHMRGKDLKS